LTDFWGIIREVDPRSIEREAHQPVKLLVCGAEGSGHRSLAAELVAGATADVVDVYEMPPDVPIALPSADAYVYVVSAGLLNSPVTRQHVWQLVRRGGIVMCAITQSWSLDDHVSDSSWGEEADALGLPLDRIISFPIDDRRAVQAEFVPRIFERAPHLALPLGKALPITRIAAAHQLIKETSRVNAEFAAVSSIPGLVPIVGGLAATGADLVVLTKNQAMLLVKLATIHGRATDSRIQLLSEIVPIVGAAFVWRWVARALVTMLPTPLSIAPRVGVAYVGTYVVGRAAAYYYDQGHRPPPELLEGFARDAATQLDLLGPIWSDVRHRFRLL
jgi:hypothetical protein